MNRKSIIFLILTFTFSWSLVLLFKMTGLEWTAQTSLFVTIPFMFMPMFSAIIVRKGIYKEKGLISSHAFKPNRWFAAAWLAPPLYALATLGVSLLFPQIEFSPGMEGFINLFRERLSPEQLSLLEDQLKTLPIHPVFLTMVQGMIAGLTINAIAGFGEEFGWRELLFKETGKNGFWKSSLLTGLFWGIWHAPVILYGHNYPEHPIIGVFMMTAWCILLAPLFSYIRYKSGSVIAASILHGTLNGVAGIAIMTISGGNDLIRGITGISGFAVLIILNLLLVPLMKKEREPWQKQFQTAQ